MITNQSAASYTVNIPTISGSFSLKFVPDRSVVFVGANGSGKTRLGVLIEGQNKLSALVTRISAHRIL